MTPDARAPVAEGSAAGRVGRGVYVYGVVAAAGDREAVAERGVGSPPAPVRVVEGERLSALVSDVRAGWEAAGREDVEAHDRVLSHVVERSAIVPMRFGVVMDSDDQVRATLLERHSDEIAALLEHVEGRVQMSVKAFYVDESLLRETLRRSPDLKRRSDALRDRPVEATQNERIALGRDVAEAVEHQRAADERLLAEPLATVADEVQVHPPASDRIALNAQLLVPRDGRSKLDDLVRRLSVEHADRFTFRYVGPLAPFSFTSLSLDAEESWD
ncbi:MAG: GvpL/GvpF family gas vesicle protein [Gaiellaceae bacterium]